MTTPTQEDEEERILTLCPHKLITSSLLWLSLVLGAGGSSLLPPKQGHVFVTLLEFTKDGSPPCGATLVAGSRSGEGGGRHGEADHFIDPHQMPARHRSTPTRPPGLIAPQGLIPRFRDPIGVRLYHPGMTIIPEGENASVFDRLADHRIHQGS